jgi:hypothetical protein
MGVGSSGEDRHAELVRRLRQARRDARRARKTCDAVVAAALDFKLTRPSLVPAPHRR